MSKPFSEACQRNQQPILTVIQPLLESEKSLLEIGSGTGQHAVYFAQALTNLSWRTSDMQENHDGINQWIEDAKLNNLQSPLTLNVLTDDWPDQQYDAVFTANTLHIMPWQAVLATFAGVGKILKPGGRFIVYGPFNYQGKFTSESNAQFENWLKAQSPEMGIRNFEDIQSVAEQHQLKLLADHAMPANNRILVWQKY